MINIIAVFFGGGMGSLFRWLICSKISTHWGTLTVNILGAFLIGVLYQYISLHSGFRQELKPVSYTHLDVYKRQSKSCVSPLW